MKRTLFVFIALVSLSFALNSCLNGEMQSTPELYASQMYRIHGGTQDTIRTTDSLSVGDSLRLPLIISGQYNHLKSFSVQSAGSVFDCRLECDSAVLAVLTDDSKPEQGVLYFKPQATVIASVNLWFVPKQSGTHRMTFSVNNDATNEQYYHRDFYIDFAIR